MKKKISGRIFKSGVAIISALSLAVLATGCGNKTGSAGKDYDLEALKTSTYPIKTDTTLKVWSYRGGASIGQFSDPTKFPTFAKWSENVGVKFDYVFPTAGQEKQQFNLLLASGELPDLVGWYWTTDTPGGAESAIRNNYIAGMNDLIDTYAPNYKSYLENNPLAEKELKTDEGNFYYVPSYVTNQSEGTVSAGYMFRQDWLDDLGLEKPETIDEWETTLKLFRDKKGAEAPLTVQAITMERGLAGAFGMQVGWYQDGKGKVKYGYAEPEYKEFIKTMNRWYSEGLLDKNLATIDTKGMDAKMLNGKSGACFNWIGGGIGKLTKAGKEKDPNYGLTAVKFPVINKGDIPKFGTKDAMTYMAGYAISGKSEHKELAMKVLDYGFTEEGRTFLNFGTEGETYNVVDGKAKFTDLINNNPDGLDKSFAMLYHVRNNENIPVLKSEKPYKSPSGKEFTYEKEYDYQSQRDAFDIWGVNEAPKYDIPKLAPSDKDYGRISTDIQSYVQEMNLKFITGAEPIENYDKFVSELKARGLDQLTKMMQDAYDRYQKR